MKQYWWLGFLGFIGLYQLPLAWRFFSQDAPVTVLLNLLWLLWFLEFIPQSKNIEK